MSVRMESSVEATGHALPVKRSAVRTIRNIAPRQEGVVKSAGRALEILEYFNEIRREAQLAEIAGALGYPLSSASVLLKSLIQLGYIDYDPHTRRYCPSARVAMLGAWLELHPLNDGRLARLTELIARRSGLAVVVAVRNGIYSQIIHVVQARGAVQYEIPRGFRCFLCWSATGYALLMRMPSIDIPLLVRRSNTERAADMPAIDTREVMRNMELAHAQGYFVSRALVTTGAGAIAMPLSEGIDRRGRPIAIAISGARGDLEIHEREYVDLLRCSIAEVLSGFPS